MRTLCLPADSASIAQAAQLLRAGEIVGFPTETVYGLGANALSDPAVRKIFAAKERPADNPLIVHIAALADMEPLCHINDMARRLAAAFWPGPLTMILPKKDIVPAVVTAGLDSVAIRMPSHPVARALIEACGLPIAAPSGNRSGRPSPTTAAHMLEDMDGRIPLILDGGPCDVGVESTVVDMTGPIPRILRPGGVTREQIASVCGAWNAIAASIQAAISKSREFASLGAVGAPDGAAVPGHATGLAYVPYDNYLARLHQGESVLTRTEAAQWREGMPGQAAQPVDYARLAQAVADALGGMAVQMDGQAVGMLVTPTVSRELGRQVRSGPYTT